MEQVKATVTELVGNAYIMQDNGERVALQQGDELMSGTIIMTEANSQVTAEGPDFRLTLPEDSMTEIPSEPLTESASNAPAILDAGADEIAALQAAILEGIDPTQAFEAAAAGIPGAGALPAGTDGEGSGNGGFVTVSRIGDERIAEAGFDTAVGPLAFDELTQLPGDILLAATPDLDGPTPTPTPDPTPEPTPTPVTMTPKVTVEIGEAMRGIATINHKTVADAGPNSASISQTVADKTNGYKISVKNDKGATTFEPNDPYISVVSPGEVNDVSGFGVSGQPLGLGKSDTGNPKEITPEQTLTVKFDQPVSELTAQFAWLNHYEFAKYTIYDDTGKDIGSGMLRGISDKIDPKFTIKAADGTPIQSIDFSAAAAGDKYSGQTIDQIESYRSDFIIHEITFKTASYEYELNISAQPGQTDGSETISSILVSVPSGASLSSGSQITGSNNWSLPLTSNGDYQVNINPDGSVSITGVTLTMPNNTPPTVTVTAQAQGAAVDGITPDAASAEGKDTAAVIETSSKNGLTIANGAAIDGTLRLDAGKLVPTTSDGKQLVFEVSLNKAVDNDTVLFFNIEGGRASNSGSVSHDLALAAPLVIIGDVNGNPIILPVTVYEHGQYSVTIPANEEGVKILAPVEDDNGSVKLTVSLNGETANGAELVNVDSDPIESSTEVNYQIGTSDNNSLTGHSSDDIIFGGDGNDIIFAGAGADKIYGGLGDDIIDLGANDGAEDIVYWTQTDAASSVAQYDKITSFELNTDRLDISDFLTQNEKDNLDDYLSAADEGNGGTLVTVSNASGAELNIALEGVTYNTEILEQILTAELLNPTP